MVRNKKERYGHIEEIKEFSSIDPYETEAVLEDEYILLMKFKVCISYFILNCLLFNFRKKKSDSDIHIAGQRGCVWPAEKLGFDTDCESNWGYVFPVPKNCD